MRTLVLLLLVSVPMFGEVRQCKSSPKIVDACYTVHGRARWGNGTPALRIWPVGTKRMLGVTASVIADDADEPNAPKSLFFASPDVEAVFGDFEVCPFTKERKGTMQMVCVESAKHLVVKKLRDK